jgi:PTS system nitrogen regulatory IIA component
MQLGVREAARLLRAPERQIYRWVEDGEIPCSRVNDQLRFNQTELLEWATARGIRVAEELFQTETDDSGGAGLAAALQRGGIHHHVPGHDRDAVLAAIVERMPFITADDRELIVEMLRAREATASTAVGDGIAIPHVRSPLVMNGTPGALTLCTLDQPVDFGGQSRGAVHTIFTMMSPTVRAHIQLLAALAAALHDAEFKAAVLERRSPAEILAQARRIDAARESPAKVKR